jgi:hypothetical protein
VGKVGAEVLCATSSGRALYAAKLCEKRAPLWKNFGRLAETMRPKMPGRERICSARWKRQSVGYYRA